MSSKKGGRMISDEIVEESNSMKERLLQKEKGSSH